MMKVAAAAGPMANLILALISGMILRIFNPVGLLTESMTVLIYYFTRINITLAVFNMIPVAPLDGSPNIFWLSNEIQSTTCLEDSIIWSTSFIWINSFWIYNWLLHSLANNVSLCEFFNVSLRDCKWVISKKLFLRILLKLDLLNGQLQCLQLFCF